MTGTTDSGAEPERLVFSIQETADLLGISTRLAYQLARDGELPTFRLGRRRILVNAAALRAQIARNAAEYAQPTDGAA